MRMNPAQLYARVLAGDVSDNGRFFFGVTTTGIYCLPSCSARKPKPENTRFFATTEAARAAGLRACKKCHPDDFARGADPVLETIEALVVEIRANPAAFADARAIVKRSGFGSTRLFELFRQHYHATPADVLLRARLAYAKTRLLACADANASKNTSLADIALEAGFESLSVFHEHFKIFNGLTPSVYREFGYAASSSSSKTPSNFEIALPAGYPLAYLLRNLGRDLHSLTERVEGNVYTCVARLGSQSTPTLLRLTFVDDRISVSVFVSVSESVSHPTLAAEVHALVIGILGLEQDAAGFTRLARKLGLARLVAGREQLRVTQTSSVFDGLLWAIIGQQINLPFAYQLKHRLIALASQPFVLPSDPLAAAGLYAPPTPADIAHLEPEQLKPLQFSRSKANYVIDTSRLIASGQLDLEALRTASATRAERTLLAIRGLGPWSVNYLMMRSLGFADCVPLGDTGVTSGLFSLFKLEERPDIEATKRLMSVFSPYRSLATTQLWQFNQPTL